MSAFVIRNVTESDLDRCFEIESISYAGDEAASKAKILTRIQTYPEGFIVLENQDEIVGFINAGATHHVALSDEAFKELVGHDPKGEFIVIMSVVVAANYQGQGMAHRLLADFIARMREMKKKAIYLICQTELIPMYAQHGFVYLGESDSNHGGLVWHEMSFSLLEKCDR